MSKKKKKAKKMYYWMKINFMILQSLIKKKTKIKNK